jgi:hypothetical protein
VREDHERIEELLAGYALRSLSGEDEAEADRLLAGHVPACLTCRRVLAEFEAVAGDLAVSADPIAPPDTTLPRIHRAMGPREDRSPTRPTALVGFAATAVAVLGLGALSFAMMNRAQVAEERTQIAFELASLMTSPGVDPEPVEPQAGAPPDSDFVQVSAPDLRRMFVLAELCPDPAPGYAYQLWLGSEGEFKPYGPMFVPYDDGSVLIQLIVDVSVYDEVWITEEVAGSRPRTPRTDGPAWRGAIA